MYKTVLFDLFRTLVESPSMMAYRQNPCVTHVRKPDAKAYQVVLDELGVSADETLLVGDGRSDELNGAVRVGIDAIQFDDLITEDKGAVGMLRVGVVDWSGPIIKSMSEVPGYVRNQL